MGENSAGLPKHCWISQWMGKGVAGKTQQNITRFSCLSQEPHWTSWKKEGSRSCPHYLLPGQTKQNKNRSKQIMSLSQYCHDPGQLHIGIVLSCSQKSSAAVLTPPAALQTCYFTEVLLPAAIALLTAWNSATSVGGFIQVKVLLNHNYHDILLSIRSGFIGKFCHFGKWISMHQYQHAHHWYTTVLKDWNTLEILCYWKNAVITKFWTWSLKRKTTESSNLNATTRRLF